MIWQEEMRRVFLREYEGKPFVLIDSGVLRSAELAARTDSVEGCIVRRDRFEISLLAAKLIGQRFDDVLKSLLVNLAVGLRVHEANLRQYRRSFGRVEKFQIGPLLRTAIDQAARCNSGGHLCRERLLRDIEHLDSTTLLAGLVGIEVNRDREIAFNRVVPVTDGRQIL